MPSAPGGLQSTTSYKVVLPFYFYGTLGFVAAALLLFIHSDIPHLGNFYPYTLAITHTMALGWGTMVILGASHQLLPVVIEAKLYSDWMGHTTFGFVAIGIPFLITGFYQGNFDWVLQTGAILINIGVLFYVINVFASIWHSQKREVHSYFMATASVWLFTTTFFGLLLVFNFRHPWLSHDSLSYLTLHAHLGIVGWFLILVTGVGSRLIPLFMISKYKSNQKLWWVFGLINAGLLSFIVFRLWFKSEKWYFASIALVLAGILLFIQFCLSARKVRIRKKIDHQVKTSFSSLVLLTVPIVLLVLILTIFPDESNIVILYGYTIFFGWITSIILGMTYKTMPFIVWNKLYKKSGTRPPAPKDLFSEKVFNVMLVFYFFGFITFFVGIIVLNDIVLKVGSASLLVAAALYAYNTNSTIFHKA